MYFFSHPQQVFKGRQLGSEGDIFMSGVQKMQLLPQKQVLSVHLGGTAWCQEILLFPVMFQLIDHLPNLLQTIHQLSQVQAKALNVR